METVETQKPEFTKEQEKIELLERKLKEAEMKLTQERVKTEFLEKQVNEVVDKLSKEHVKIEFIERKLNDAEKGLAKMHNKNTQVMNAYFTFLAKKIKYYNGQKLVNNNFVYEEIFDNLEEKDLYKLWGMDLFRESVKDYMLKSNRIVWKIFLEHFNLDPDFIETFSNKLITKCRVCTCQLILKECRTVKEFQFCTFTSGSEFKYSQICDYCYNNSKLSNPDCDKCDGKQIGCVIVQTEDELHQRFFFTCCPPSRKNLCTCDKEYTDENQLFCLTHREDTFATNCETICEECYFEF